MGPLALLTGWLTALGPVDLASVLEGRADEEAGEEHLVVGALVEGGPEPVQTSCARPSPSTTTRAGPPS